MPTILALQLAVTLARPDVGLTNGFDVPVHPPSSGRQRAAPRNPVGGDAEASSVPFESKKARWLAEKSARAGQARSGSPLHPPTRRAVAPVFAQNLRTREIAILDGPGALPADRIDRFFQCWFTGDYVDVPDVLVERVVGTARTFGVRHVKIVSSYRAPKYNLSLVKKGREVARDSEHTRGQAIDFQLVGVPVLAVYEHLLAVHPGGVGYYPVSEFVHVDVGRKRTWRGT